MKKIIASFLFGFVSIFVAAQNPYTVKKFKDYKISNVIYGVDTAFNGFVDTLKMDIYRPIGDTNCKRPVVLIVHGGAWLGGDKADGGIVAICHEFTARGYVVASVNYRMGMHPASYYVPYAVCVHEKCSYVADTAEWVRANYRASQDVKSAIRFMKQRNYLDSSDHNNVFLLGESAGAFSVNMAAWMDKNTEKPMACYAIADAPTPDADLNSCIINKTIRKRPDLGIVQGKGNINAYNATVKGVASFYGGILDTSIFKQTLASDTPILYLYHQTCDVVVDNNLRKLFWKVFNYCYNPLNLCMPFSSGPYAWGSTAIKKHLDGVSYIKPRLKYTLVTTGGAYSCDPSSNCHGIDNMPNRIKEVLDYFSPTIQVAGNVPGLQKCYFNVEKPAKSSLGFSVYPNPTSGIIHIRNSATSGPFIATCILSGMEGKQVLKAEIAVLNGQYSMVIPKEIKAGIYSLNIISKFGTQCIKLILEK